MKKNEKLKEELSVMDAVDELSKMAEIDHRLSTPELEGRELKPEKVKQTFRVLHNYLKHLYEHDKGHFEDPQTRQGVQAIMVMANEAAQKIDRFTALFSGVHGEAVSIKEVKEFQELQGFYLNKIMKKFEATLASEGAWQAEWAGQEVDLLDIQRRGLKDLQTIRRDKDYELFFIRKEDGRPFYNRNLMRHIRLVGEFDEAITDPSGDDPFLQIKAMEDGQLHDAAKQIVEETRSLINTFYKEALRHKESAFISNLTKGIMALFLSANPRNMMQHTNNKSAILYFYDFQLYLRKALATAEYKKALETPGEQLEPFMTIALQLANKLALHFFVRKQHRVQATDFLLKLFEKATHHRPLTQEGKNPLWLWNSLFEDDEKLRNLLKHYPNGPLMKTLDVLRHGEEMEGFDPLIQENHPYTLFKIAGGAVSATFLHLPAPIRQTHINQVKISREFKAFIRGLAQQGKKEKLLLINLQNRTSWQEHARSSALEELQKNGEFKDCLVVITLPMDTDFYYQSENYEKLDDTKTFMNQMLEQLASGEECGFYFPPSIDVTELQKYTKEVVSQIHEFFFAKKDLLTRKNRLDFIELFYLFLTFYLLETVRPDFVSFTSKDAIDTGAVMSAAAYSLLKILRSKPGWSEKEKESLLYLLYAPSLILRERLIDKGRLHRSVSAISLVQAELESHGDKLRKMLNALYGEPLFDLLEVE